MYLRDRPMDKVSCKVDAHWCRWIITKKRLSFIVAERKKYFLENLMPINDRLTEQVNYILDIHTYKDSVKKIRQLSWITTEKFMFTLNRF